MSIEAMKRAKAVMANVRDWFGNDPIHRWDEDEVYHELVDAVVDLNKAIAKAEKQEPVVHQDWCASLTRLLLSMPPQPAPCDCQPIKRKAEKQERYFCERCGKRLSGGIHTCTPPAEAEKQEPVIDGNTSDGYHTFNELYEFRKAYNAALFNEWAACGKCSVHKSWRHHDGELCFGGGWFIVVAVLPQGQISNHYEANDWDLFAVPETERALFEFDGHTGSDVVARLKSYTHPPKREWVGLTMEEIDLLEELYAPPVHPDFANDASHCLELIRHVEAKLKAKNGFPQEERNT